MTGKRKQHTAAFKAQVALAAVKGDRTINELASHFGVHPTLIHGWKKQLLAGAEAVFANGVRAGTADAEARQAELFEQIGRLKMELEWVKKKLPFSVERQLISTSDWLPSASEDHALFRTVGLHRRSLDVGKVFAVFLKVFKG